MTGKYLIVIAGPTASGKTRMAIRLARHFNADILSADARQFYREMNIATAKPTTEELAQAPHHFINTLSVKDDYAAGQFEQDALQLLDRLFAEKDVVLMAGGSGLYIKAVCEGFDELPETVPEIREQLNRQLEKEGLEKLQAMLRELDPVYFANTDIQNPRRLIRALEICLATGRPFSDFHSRTAAERPFHILKIGLKADRQELYARINRRVDEWMENGLLEEARALYPGRHFNALQTVGYQELFDHFDGLISLEKAVELIKRNNRRYAKRQMTWFGKDPEIQWFDAEQYDDILHYIESKIQAAC